MSKWFLKHAWRLMLVTGLTAMLGIAVACGDDDDDDTTGTPTSAATTPGGGDEGVDALAAIFYPESGRVALREALEQGIIDEFLFVDGTKSQQMFDDIGAESFEGMCGTQPGGPNEEFAAALSAAGGDPDAPYVREGYDAAYLIALAAVSANSTKGADIRDNLRFVANPPGEKIGLGADEFERAVGLLEQGEDIDFEGASGPGDQDANGDLASGLVEVWCIKDGKITHERNEEANLAEQNDVDVPAGSQVRQSTAPTSALKIGAIMSQTGDLSDFGPPIVKSIQMAIDEINSAGGVFGQDVTLVVGDDATNPDQGQSEARRLIDVEGVSAIIGALASSVSVPIAENVTGPAGVLQISPASTAPTLTTANDSDFLFRLPISDAAQGIVLAKLAQERGYDTVCTLYVNSDYGKGLSDFFTAAFEDLGGSVPQAVPIEQQQTTYVSELRRCASS
jgi:ABC-type branched-subunit amino acid transport system substrate-binding protein